MGATMNAAIYACLGAVLLTMAACGAPQPPMPGWLPWAPQYSADIGVDGVVLEPAQLEGRWLVQKEFGTVVYLPIVGRRNAGARSGQVADIVYVEQAGHYRVTLHWCWNDVYEVEGTQTRFDDATMQSLRDQEVTFDVDHARGEFTSSTVVDLWGLQNLPDPQNTPLPTKDNHQSPPQSDWVLDEDQDGHPGVTAHVSGVFDGDVYVIDRTVHGMTGVARTQHELLGLLPVSKIQENLLGGTMDVPGDGSTRQEPDPDPKVSWFQMVRTLDTATCDDAQAARADGRFATRRPF